MDKLLLPYELRRDHRPVATARIDLSVVAPAYEERDNLGPLVEAVRDALDASMRWELVIVDDGSRDGTGDVLRRLASEEPRVTAVYLRENRGQTAATAAGIAVARGRLIATIDADLQNDPADLPGMVEALGDADAVVGVRTKRRDSIVRRLSSRVANWVRNRLSGDSIQDTGCALKVFRAEALETLPLFEGMHRFLPTLLRIHGFEVLERPVGHHPRTAGRSKYGVWNRAFRALRDLLAVRWMRSRVIRLPLDGIDRAEERRPTG